MFEITFKSQISLSVMELPESRQSGWSPPFYTLFHIKLSLIISADIMSQRKGQVWQALSKALNIYCRTVRIGMSQCKVYFTQGYPFTFIMRAPTPQKTWLHTTGPKPHQLKSQPPKTESQTPTPNPYSQTTINEQKLENIAWGMTLGK